VGALDTGHPQRALQERDFRLTCRSGFGDGWNHYAHSMAWFQGRLYVGTARANLAALRINKPVPDMRPWPIECPDRIDDIDRRAQIWEYTPETDHWECVYRAPWVQAKDGSQISNFLSFRGMSVFRGKTDSAPCLYVSTWSPMKAGPSELLRSEDGRHFEKAPRPAWSPAVRSFRSLCEFQGRVHTSPISSGVAQGAISDSLGSDPTIYVTDDPRTGGWIPANERGFGNSKNLTVFELEVYEDHLYAGVVNATTGAELWKTRGGTPPYQWECVSRGGFGRGVLNEAVGSLCVFRGALYVGVGILNGGYHRAMRIGPAAAELVRVWPDDSWELVMGEARIVDGALRYPLSGYASGYDSLFNGYVWRMCVHQGHLYAGTFNWANLIPYLPRHTWPEDVQGLVQHWGEEALIRRFGAFELWRSADGIIWEPVTRSGFGNQYSWGIRTLQSTKHGLFVGTVNAFGPKVAVRRGGDWRYVFNPRGGCEVWLGQKSAAEA
jgi:hypothetical protein